MILLWVFIPKENENKVFTSKFAMFRFFYGKGHWELILSKAEKSDICV